jgi:hypothetical protein
VKKEDDEKNKEGDYDSNNPFSRDIPCLYSGDGECAFYDDLPQ